MQTIFINWLQRQVSDPERLRDEGVFRFALRITMQLVLAACVINVLGHVVIDRLGLLPYPLSQALIIGLILTVAITTAAGLSVVGVIGQSILTLSIQRDMFERLSHQDQLSGLRNRRSFFERFERDAIPGRLILLDVDHFKKINDEFGHSVGDEAIRRIGEALACVFTDPAVIVGRVGGEEFAVFVPEDLHRANEELAEAARRAIAAMTVAGISRPVTISLGMATRIAERSAIEVYAAADRALYLAKAGGRNRVVCEGHMTALNTPRLFGQTAAG